jgi:methionyl-tRNA formyltransferase
MYKIVFMGTPYFAVPSLEALHKSRHRVELVVTQPDRPKGRGKKLAPSPVKIKARELGYRIEQPEMVQAQSFYNDLREIAPDFFVVVAYGHILKKRLLALPRLGAVNVHASLLPEYRGPAPIQHALLNRERETGVTTMLLDEGVDTGDILFWEKSTIKENDTAETLHDRLAIAGARLLVQTLDKIYENGLNPVAQNDSRATYAPMLKKTDGLIDWSRDAEDIEAHIRAMTPWPGAYTFYQGERLKIFKARVAGGESDNPPGTVIPGFPDELRVATGKGALAITELQGKSGKRLFAEDYLRGRPIMPGAVLQSHGR